MDMFVSDKRSSLLRRCVERVLQHRA